MENIERIRQEMAELENGHCPSKNTEELLQETIESISNSEPRNNLWLNLLDKVVLGNPFGPNANHSTEDMK